jgi:hypothetical protein
MTFGGNIKQRISLYLAVASFVASMLCAVEGNMPMTFLLLVLGLIFGAGVWALGLNKAVDPDAEEWADSIR